MSALDHPHSPEAFALSEHDLGPGQREIQVVGELDLAVAERLRDAIEHAQGAHVLLIDLAGCPFIDSTAIAVLVRAQQGAADEGRVFAVHSAADQVSRVFRVTGLIGNGLVFASRAEALAAAAG